MSSDEKEKLDAYTDSAWRKGNLHLSAPCIYTKAMEALDFKLNCSFLNIGSGTGYLSTMVGLLIGSGGINHGVELYESNVEYARSKLDEFKLTSPWYDPALFGDPHFVVGNGLLLSSNNRRYDRIYCGAACTTTESQELFRSLLEINGVLVMPTESQVSGLLPFTNYQCTIFLHAYCIYFRVSTYRELNLVRALNEDTRVFSFFSSYSPLGQTVISGNSTLHQ